MNTPKVTENCAAAMIARFLKARGVDRVFALCGGHIMPIWMRVDAEGIRIIDVRDERAAVYMAHAHAELTGKLGVALITAGPGVTNAMTGIANAHVARAPVMVISGTPPRPQENRGALQDMSHTDFVRPLTRYARTVREPSLVLQELDEAVSRAFGQGGEPGPVYVDFPVDTLRGEVPRALQLAEHFAPKEKSRILPDTTAVDKAVDLLWSARRPLVISGRGARGAGPALVRLLDRVGALYLDTGESRGLVPDEHPSVVGAMRGSVMGDADLVVTVGRRLDFQLAYGSPSVFGDARFLRIADCGAELRDNRRGAVEIFATPDATLEAMLERAGDRAPATDREWAAKVRAKHTERADKLASSLRAAAPEHYARAAADPGASGWQVMRLVILPLTLPGVMTGAFLTFVLCIGDYITPQILGGNNELTMPQLIMLQLGRRGDFPMASALSVVLMALVTLAYAASARWLKMDRV